jgi:hypothetical protein
MEAWVEVLNKTGSTIAEGIPVYVSGGQGGVGTDITVAPAYINGEKTHRCIGITTTTITNNNTGLVTMYGVVNGLDTSAWTNGTDVYLSDVAGILVGTNTEVYVGTVKRQNANSGQIWVNPHHRPFHNEDEIDPRLNAQNTAMLDPTGFENNSTEHLFYSPTARTITITNGGADISLWWRGTNVNLGKTWTSSAHATNSGIYYLAMRTTTNFEWSTQPWTFDMAQASVVYYDHSATNGWAMEETHGLMPWPTHEEFHRNIGAYVDNGIELVAGTYVFQDGTSPTNVTPAWSAGAVHDEDNHTDLDAKGTGSYTRVWFVGSTVRFTTNSPTLVQVTGTYPDINTWNGSTFSTNEAGVNKFFNLWVGVAPMADDARSQQYRLFIVQPQKQHDSLASAQAETTLNLNMAQFTMLGPEYVFRYKLTGRTGGGYSTVGKWRIEAIELLTGNAMQQVSISGATAVNTADAIGTTVTAFDKILSSADTTVQKALDTLDDGAVPTNRTVTVNGVVGSLDSNVTFTVTGTGGGGDVYSASNNVFTSVSNRFNGTVNIASNIYDSSGTCIAGALYTNYVINIPTNWNTGDIEDAVARVPPSIMGTNTALILDWDDGTHSYTTNCLNLTRMFNNFSWGSQTKVFQNTNFPIRLIGNITNPSACVLQFSNSGGENNGIITEVGCAINGFTVLATNATRSANGISVRKSLVTVCNTVCSNWNIGFTVFYGGATYCSNVTAVSCNSGFFSSASGQHTLLSSLATNCSYGYASDRNSYINVAGGYAKAYSCDVGFSASSRGVIDATSSTCISNRIAYQALTAGYIYAASCAEPTNVGTVASSPFWDTADADGSMVYRWGNKTTINTGGIDTPDKLNNIIQNMGKNLNANTYAMYCTSNTFTNTYVIGISNFYTGALIVYGTNFSAYANATNQATIFNLRGVSNAIPVFQMGYNSAFITIRGVKIFPANNVNSSGIYAQNGNSGPINFRDCSIIGTNNTCSYGINASSPEVNINVVNSVGASLYMFGISSVGAKLIYNNSNTTNLSPLCAYAGYASVGGQIYVKNANTNYPAATASWGITEGGLIVTNVGKILP